MILIGRFDELSYWLRQISGRLQLIPGVLITALSATHLKVTTLEGAANMASFLRDGPTSDTGRPDGEASNVGIPVTAGGSWRIPEFTNDARASWLVNLCPKILLIPRVYP